MIHLIYSYTSTDGLTCSTGIDFPVERDTFEQLQRQFRAQRDSQGLESLPDLEQHGADNEVWCRICYNHQWRRFLAFCRRQGVQWTVDLMVEPAQGCAPELSAENERQRRLQDQRMRDHYYQYSINDSSTPRDWDDALAERRLPQNGAGVVDFEPDIQPV